MPDIFGYQRHPKARGVFSSENSKLMFGSENPSETATYLVQSWNVQYQQQVQELFEIGSNHLYWAKGRPVGQGTIARLVGDKEVIAGSDKFFPADAYDICKGGVLLKLQSAGGACRDAVAGGVKLDKGVDITMNGCVVTSIGFGMQVADVRLVENVAWRFAYMEVKSYTNPFNAEGTAT